MIDIFRSSYSTEKTNRSVWNVDKDSVVLLLFTLDLRDFPFPCHSDCLSIATFVSLVVRIF